jgi:radical SAM superfamily enzyme YgiQ (UPF0313 family)
MGSVSDTMSDFSSQKTSKQELVQLGLDNPKNATMISCPWIFQEYVEFRSQNMGLAYVGGFLEECGHKIIKYIDPMINGGDTIKTALFNDAHSMYRFGLSDQDIVNAIPKDTEYILINAPFTDSKFVLYPLCEAIKETCPDMIIIVGGVLATSLSIEIIKNSKVDIVVKGEGEISSAKILGGCKLSDIDGVVYKKNGVIYESKHNSEQFLDINELPLLKDGGFRPIEEYIKWSPRGNKADRTFSYITSRGCPFNCNFCSIPEKNQRWRSFSTKRVIQEIDYVIENYGINHIEIEDDNFTLKPDHSRPVLKYIADLRSSGVDITLSFPNGVMTKTLQREDVSAFKAAGVDILYLAVESGDKKNLILMNKSEPFKHLDNVLRVTEWCNEEDIKSGSFFILGYPGGIVSNLKYKEFILEHYHDDIIARENDDLVVRGETEESFLKTFDFMKKMKGAGVDFITPLIATPYPATNLYDVCKKFSWFRNNDTLNMLTTISYNNLQKDNINIETPWCSAEDAFNRWKMVAEYFPVKHNVIKE